MNYRNVFVTLATIAATAFLGCQPASKQATTQPWPSQPITLSCNAAAGGAMDQVARWVAQEMEKSLGVTIHVVNHPEGRESAAANDVMNRDHDGYTWAGFSESILQNSVLDLTETQAKDWTFFLVAGAPAVLSVPQNSPRNNLDDLISAAKKNPGKIKVAASLAGSVWHTKLLALQEAAGVDFLYLPYPESQSSQKAALSGEVDAVLTSISEQMERIEGGDLKPLAILEPHPYTLRDGTLIHSAADTFGALSESPVSQFLGFALPNDTPEPIIALITEAFEKMMSSPEAKAFSEKRQLDLLGLHGDEARELTQRAEQVWTWKLFDLGIAKKSPASIGIPRPSSQ